MRLLVPNNNQANHKKVLSMPCKAILYQGILATHKLWKLNYLIHIYTLTSKIMSLITSLYVYIYTETLLLKTF